MDQSGVQPPDADQLRILEACRVAKGKLRWARGLARLNVFSLGLFAFYSLLFHSLDAELSWLGLCLAGLAYNEERGRRQLMELLPRAARSLALNQLALLLLVLFYCGYQALAIWTEPEPFEALAESSAEVSDALELLKGQGNNSSELLEWARSAALVAYGVSAAVSLLVQGLIAYYYESRRSVIEVLAKAPAWARPL